MQKALFILRVLAALPLIAIGVQHLTGMAPMQPILEGAGLPLPDLIAKLAPVVEIAAGLLLLGGYRVRLGALLAGGSMIGALLAHLRFDWPEEPPLALPIAILMVSLLVFRSGAGALSLDRAGSVSRDGTRTAARPR